MLSRSRYSADARAVLCRWSLGTRPVAARCSSQESKNNPYGPMHPWCGPARSARTRGLRPPSGPAVRSAETGKRLPITGTARQAAKTAAGAASRLARYHPRASRAHGRLRGSWAARSQWARFGPSARRRRLGGGLGDGRDRAKRRAHGHSPLPVCATRREISLQAVRVRAGAPQPVPRPGVVSSWAPFPNECTDGGP